MGMIKGLAKFTIAAAAVGGICYAFKDQIKESKVYKDYDVENKIKKVKKAIEEKLPTPADEQADDIDLDDTFSDLDAVAAAADEDAILD